MNLVGLLRQARRGWCLGLIVFIVAAAAAAAGVYARRPSFESTAAILVNVERLGVSASRADIRQDTAVLQTAEAVSSQVEIIRSRDLIEQLAVSLDPALFQPKPSRYAWVRFAVDTEHAITDAFQNWLRAAALIPAANPHYEVVHRIENGLDVSAVRQTQVVRISYRDSNPETARTVLKALIKLYIARTTDEKLNRDEAGVMSGEATHVREQLEATETDLFALKAKYGISDLQLEKNTLTDRVNRLTNVLEGVGGRGMSAPQPGGGRTAATSAAPGQPGGTGHSVLDLTPGETGAAGGASGQQITDLRSQLNALRVERAGLLAMYDSSATRVRTLDQQIARTDALLTEEVGSVRQAIMGYQRRLQTLLSLEPELTRLQRSDAILSDSYEVYRKAAEDRQLTQREEARVQLQVIDPPSLPYVPRGPAPIVLLLGGLALAVILGMLGAAAAGLLAERRRQAFLFKSKRVVATGGH